MTKVKIISSPGGLAYTEPYQGSLSWSRQYHIVPHNYPIEVTLNKHIQRMIDTEAVRIATGDEPDPPIYPPTGCPKPGWPYAGWTGCQKIKVMSKAHDPSVPLWPHGKSINSNLPIEYWYTDWIKSLLEQKRLMIFTYEGGASISAPYHPDMWRGNTQDQARIEKKPEDDIQQNLPDGKVEKQVIKGKK